MEARRIRVDLRDQPHDPASLAGPDEDIDFATRLDPATGDFVVELRSTRQPAATIWVPKADVDAAMRAPDAVRDPALAEIGRRHQDHRRGHVALTLAMRQFRELADPDA